MPDTGALVPAASLGRTMLAPGAVRDLPAEHRERLAVVGALPLLRHHDRAVHEAFVDFFTTRLANALTRRTYLQAVGRFLTWSESVGVHDLRAVTPAILADYRDALLQDAGARSPESRRGSGTLETSTIKKELAALSGLFKLLAERGLVDYNPVAQIRRPRLTVEKGSTPVFPASVAGQVFEHLESAAAEDLVAKRDLAILATLFFTFLRVAECSRLNVEHYAHDGRRSSLRVHRKRGRVGSIPVHHRLAECLDAWLEEAGHGNTLSAPLFLKFDLRRRLTSDRLNSAGIYWVVRRRFEAAGVRGRFSTHSFRGAGITYFRERGGSLEDARELAGHSDLRTTAMYDRSREKDLQSEVERMAWPEPEEAESL